MKFIAVASIIIFTLLGIVAGVEVAVPAPVPAGIEARDVNRVNPDIGGGCARSFYCHCNKITGDFCGNQTKNKACTDGDAFFCFADGSTCDFGFNLNCTVCNQLVCPGFSA